MRLATALVEAWAAKAAKALAILQAAAQAPALFKPDTVEQARRDYAHAMSNYADAIDEELGA